MVPKLSDPYNQNNFKSESAEQILNVMVIPWPSAHSTRKYKQKV